MNVKDLISRWLYDSSVPVFFNIHNKMYNYFEAASNTSLHSIEVNNIKVTIKMMELTEEDIIIESNSEANVELILPANSHYHMIIISIK
jgi:hypothetical protein